MIIKANFFKKKTNKINKTIIIKQNKIEKYI